MRRFILAAALACAAATPAAAQPSQPVPRAILDQLVTLVNDREDFPDAAALARFVELSRHELNGDGSPEYFVRGTGPFCGASGNCRELVFTRGANGGYRLLLDASGKALARRTASTNGWRDLAQDGHFSAYETIRDAYQYDGGRYVPTTSEMLEGRGGATRVAYRLRTPLGSPRHVELEPVETGAPGVRLSGTYVACATPTPGRLCGTPRLRLGAVPPAGSGGCVTMDLETTDGIPRVVFARCTARSGGGADVSFTFDAADWMHLARAMTIRLSGPGVDVELPDGAQMGLSAFAAEVLEMNGIDPWSDVES